MPASGPSVLARGPLTWTQEMLFHLDARTGGRPPLGLHHAVLLHGRLDAEALVRAFQWVVARHEPLRTRYVRRGGVPRAEVLPPGPGDFRRHDLRSLPAALRAAALRAIVQGAAQRPFDLAGGRSARITLVRLEEARWGFLLDVHHLSADAWSLSLLITDLSAAYRRLAAGARPSPPAPAPGCLEEARRQHAWLATPAAQAQLEWWQGRLAALRPARLDLPDLAARRGRAPTSFARRRQAAHLPVAVLRRARDAATGARASLFMLLLAAFKSLLARRSGQSPIVVGTLVANRATTRAAATLGAHYNTVLVVTDVSAELSPRAVLDRVARSCLESFEHQALPAALVTTTAEWTLGLSSDTLLQFMFTFGHRPLYELDVGVGVWEIDLASGRPPRSPALTEHWAAETAEIVCIVWESDAGLTVHIDYPKGVLEDAAVRRLLEDYLHLLDVFVYALGRPHRPGRRGADPRNDQFGLIRKAPPGRKPWLVPGRSR